MTGSGAAIGDALVSHPAVRKVTFTGSQEVGEHITHVAGLKKVTMELGSNSPLIVLPDADMDKVTDATVQSGYSNAGQVCISTQRVIVDQAVYADYLDALAPKVEALSVGNPEDEAIMVGPMVRQNDAERVESWIGEAVGAGARLVTGGGRDSAMVAPAILADVRPDMRFSRDELFGPAVGVTPRRRHRPGDRIRQRHPVRSLGRDLHREHRQRPEVCHKRGLRQPEHQRGHPVQGRPNALWRA